MERTILLLGATGTIGRATLVAGLARGWRMVCPVRPGSVLPDGAVAREIASFDADTIAAVLHGETPDAVISCLAARGGTPSEAWAIDHRATVAGVEAARRAGARHAVLLSAICVQRPLLAFQRAKLAAERDVVASGLRYSIVRPTAFFKSLSGQIARVQAGKPFLVFGDGRLTACKPISDRDLAQYLLECLDTPGRHDRILPIGGPGPALTPLDQGRMLFDLTGRPPRIRHVSPRLLTGIAAGLSTLGRLSPRLRDRAELARIGHYYATQSMLVLDPDTGAFDADATPEAGHDLLRDHYARVIATGSRVDLGAHALFDRSSGGRP